MILSEEDFTKETNFLRRNFNEICRLVCSEKLVYHEQQKFSVSRGVEQVEWTIRQLISGSDCPSTRTFEQAL